VDAPGRVVHPLVVIALVLVAACGYLAGTRHGSSSQTPVEDPPSSTHELSIAGLLLEYPTQWRELHDGLTIPGLTLAHSVTIEPTGQSEVGLIVGQIPPNATGPLPAAFLSKLQQPPHVEVVGLVSTQAFRYSGLQFPAPLNALDLYVIPAAGGAARAVGCFARERLAPASQQCERSVANVALTGPSTATLTPEPVYAKQLASLVGSLNTARVRVRKQIGGSGSAADVAGSSSKLAVRLAAAGRSLALLEPPQLAAGAGVALAKALRGTGRAYAALAKAAKAEDVAAYDAARTQVGTTESNVDAALENFAMLGYGSP
jgi:hypothetical protein